MKEISDGAVAILVPIALFLAGFGIVYVIVSALHRERMAMIERGMMPSRNPAGRRQRILLWFILLISLGIGLGVGNYVDQHTTLDVGYAVSVMLSAGLGLGVYLLITRNDKNAVPPQSPSLSQNVGL